MEDKMDYQKLSAEEKQALVEKARDRAFFYEQEYGNCPQSTLAGLKDVFNGISDEAFRSVFGFGAGAGLCSKGMCGAVVGAITVISLATGRQVEELEQEVDYTCFTLTRQIIEAFEKKYGGVLCCQIQQKLFGRSFDLYLPEESEAFVAAGGHGDKCPSVVGFGAELVAQMIVDGVITLPED